MSKIERCYGVDTGIGFLVGAGVTGKTQALDSMVKEAAKLLQEHFDVDITIRFNSNRRSGGAFVADGVMSDKVGITVGLYNPVLRAMDAKQKMELTEKEYQAYVEAADRLEVSSCLEKEFLKEESSFIIHTHEFRDFGSINEALDWLVNGTNSRMLDYIAELKQHRSGPGI